MGAVVLVLGKSGSGKSTSLRNFKPDEIGILNILGKPLPFKGGARFEQIRRPNYAMVASVLDRNSKRAYVIDDSTYLMQNENFARAKEPGYDKFTEMAMHFQQVIDHALGTDEDTIVYMLHHTDENADGSEKVKTVGRMIDERYCVEGACTVVIDCIVQDGKHLFVTRNDGTNLAKAPMESLPDVMDNDLKAVDTALREYWGMKPIVETVQSPKKKGNAHESDQ